MADNQQSFNVNFSGDIDTKTDPFQVAPNNFLAINNIIRTTGGRLQKRNGFQNLGSFSAPYVTNLAVFNGALVGIGSSLQIYSPDSGSLISRGAFQPIGLSTLPAVRNSATQTSVDVAIAPNGLACVICADSQASLIYQIIDSATGNVIIPITQINAAAVLGRVFILGSYFLMTYCLSGDLKYIAIPYASPSATPTTGTIGTGAETSPYAYDGEVNVASTFFYFSYAKTGSNTIAINRLSSALSPGSEQTFTNTYPVNGFISVTVDIGNNAVWLTWSGYNSGTTTLFIYTQAYNSSLGNVLGTTQIYDDGGLFGFDTLTGLTSIAYGGVMTAIVSTNRSSVYTPIGAQTLSWVTCTATPVINGPATFLFGLTIAGKPFINFTNNTIYFLAFFGQSSFQQTYFIADISGNIVAKLAYSNGGEPSSVVFSSPNSQNNGSIVTYGYLYQDLISSVNKANGSPASGIYSQSGANLAQFIFNDSNIVASQIGGSLQLSGGFLWMYDGQKPVENNFHIWPDPVLVTTSGSGGGVDSADQPFYYQVTYEWTDAAGNIHRSAPSIPVLVDGLTGNTNTISLRIPTLQFTAKVAPNPVRMVVYRWSTSNQVYYQVSSQDVVTTNNSLTLNQVGFPLGAQLFTDVLPDSSVVGNNILYTTGGVVEDIGGPATELMALFDTRLWLVDAEDPNLLWFSKQVIEATPVEMSDLLTFYIAPTTSSQASTGPITGLAAMDDKLIIFKGNPAFQNAIYYINGTGPDNTGANNQYSQPIFITSAVGCDNQQSIVLTPQGLMFQSSQGIWMLGRDLQTSYIGAPVEAYNSQTVTSAVSVPNTTQIRFTLNSGTELVYDYFFQKWDTCSPPSMISSVIYQGLHTALDASGNLWQEDPGSYVDGSTPVNQSLTTPWYNLAGLQGYIRAYYFYLLGTYLSPHTLTIQIYYDYELTPAQTIVWNPNYTNPNGTMVSGALEQEKFFFDRQKCQAVKFSITENFDSEFGGTAGAGLTLSGINFTLGIMKSFRPTISAEKSAG